MAVDTRVQEFLEQGYLPVPRFLDDDLLERIRAHSAAELERLQANPVDDPLVVYEKLGDGQPRIVKRLSRVIERDEIYRRVASHPTPLGLIKGILGPEVEVCLNRHDMMNVKQARYGEGFDWHADGDGWGHYDIVSLYVAIDPSTVENGCLEVIPGSHKLRNLAFRDKYYLDLNLPEHRALAARGVKVPCEPGAGLLFDCRTLHASQPNRTDQHRRGLIFGYLTTTAKAALTGARPIEGVRLY